ncbi:hypothetical protein [Xanthobacter flavus]|uniref:hypothetical protein n=1 Tax=Xanthobacter flavus TaxID=281 RepID=UPI003729B879
MKVDQPKEDPELIAARQRAEADRVRTVQDQLGGETDRVFRMFGARTALSGASLSAPRLMGGR